ncbi:MAG: HAD hydrolase family protein [Planctomycetes bacterium]|nr:HAD hydrolase family protein [Planctomycetota bacterium]
MDVDGTLTDGTITYGPAGSEWKSFHARDGMGVALLRHAGIVPAIVTGRSSDIVERRAKELGIHDVVQGAKDKAAEVRALAQRHGLALDAVAYAGDDLSDLAPMRLAAFSAAPADAAPEVRQAATFVATAPGGRGAVREAVEALLRREGTWERALAACVGGGGASS